MSKITVDDIRHIIPEPLTKKQEDALNLYLKDGIVPPADPCLSCETNLIRQYISRIQVAERSGGLRRVDLWNEFIPAQDKDTEEVPESAGEGRPALVDEFVPERVIAVSDNPSDPNVSFEEVFKPEPKTRKGK